jgi:hypothetical protein
VFYYDGAVHKPQHLALLLYNKLDLEAFYRKLRKSLGIYKNSKFKVILLKNGSDIKILEKMEDFVFDVTNDIKIVPVDYI